MGTTPLQCAATMARAARKSSLRLRRSPVEQPGSTERHRCFRRRHEPESTASRALARSTLSWMGRSAWPLMTLSLRSRSTIARSPVRHEAPGWLVICRTQSVRQAARFSSASLREYLDALCIFRPQRLQNLRPGGFGLGEFVKPGQGSLVGLAMATTGRADCNHQV